MNKEKQIVRNWLKVFIAALFISGFTAIPVEQELTYVVNHFPFEGSIKGFLEIVVGLINTQFLRSGLYFWAAGFGLLHIIYGFVMWWKYEKNG